MKFFLILISLCVFNINAQNNTPPVSGGSGVANLTQVVEGQKKTLERIKALREKAQQIKILAKRG